ncbi:hypothetical protein ASPZODRAFT_2009191 [Penicilliopsis zonata CBS 506.65]|uniref:Extracellular mutant protein 11 C-terminal domain-containing protein n=1 Tax=Penicilliopsis zonata CBS 506.65 TaxID=1073090 RepID=A0A1L9SHY6_9EURO|nr:hypothetical protein ASPZODRAFT_2009191 [Penicilliopsis zonata CBS 506.65]OJJ46716.1 hypothetical protein ASPZODRAFT_2009191 [Penicilliopsis zonata CBS 506.65]
MPVGNYVRSKEAGPFRPTTDEGGVPRRSRQFLADQVKVEVPATRLVGPTFSEASGGQHSGFPLDAPPNGFHIQQENGVQRDMFDTDVEGVDDSTIAGTSVMDVDEFKMPISSYSRAPPQGTDSQPLYHPPPPEPQAREFKWSDYEAAADVAGYNSDDADSEGSHRTFVLGDENTNKPTEEPVQINNWYLSQKVRTVEEPRPTSSSSRRLENFWAASKRTNGKSTTLSQLEAKPLGLVPAVTSGSKLTGKVLPVNGSRRIVLPRSMTTTPKSRFSPPKPSLLEQLDLSPTRQTSGPRPQPGGKKTTVAKSPPPQDDENDAGILSDTRRDRRDSSLSTSAFDLTNIDILDHTGIDHTDDGHDDDTLDDLYPDRPPIRINIRETTESKKTQIEADYPIDVIRQKSFSDLQAEPFDRIPSPVPQQASSPEPVDPSDMISALLRFSGQERNNYLSNLTIDEWEDCGDQLLDRFSNMLTQMKDLRRARRKTAAAFEAEIKRRHESVQNENLNLSNQLSEMRKGGIDVLRGRSPPNPSP